MSAVYITVDAERNFSSIIIIIIILVIFIIKTYTTSCVFCKEPYLLCLISNITLLNPLSTLDHHNTLF